MDFIRVRVAQIVCVLPETSRAQTFIKNLFARKSLVKEAVKSVSFDIGPGECVGFLGPNGAGKTTTLKMLSGILYPTSGKPLYSDMCHGSERTSSNGCSPL